MQDSNWIICQNLIRQDEIQTVSYQRSKFKLVYYFIELVQNKQIYPTSYIQFRIKHEIRKSSVKLSMYSIFEVLTILSKL